MAAVRTVVISDLHLGSGSGTDVLRKKHIRELLFERLEDVERLVLLGDVVELRDRSVENTLDAVKPIMAEFNEVMAGGEIVFSLGNHDHQLDPWPQRRRLLTDPEPLALEQIRQPEPDGPLARLTEALPDVDTKLAYPGLWLRDDVFALHGHYLDLHSSVPSFENIGAAALQKGLGIDPDNPEQGPTDPATYEDVLAPLYAFSFAFAQADRNKQMGPRASADMMTKIASSRPRALLFGGVAIPAAIAFLNRLGIGTFSSDLRANQLALAGVQAMGAVTARLGIDAKHVIYGHTHRSGPHPSDGDIPWNIDGGPRLINPGSWVFEEGTFGTPDDPDSPWYPGRLVELDAEGPPRLVQVLDSSVDVPRPSESID
ncbi:MAG: metallophosphoesterase [Solirubrobacterales bacterium]